CTAKVLPPAPFCKGAFSPRGVLRPGISRWPQGHDRQGLAVKKSLDSCSRLPGREGRPCLGQGRAGRLSGCCRRDHPGTLAMLFDPLLERFAQGPPLTVMTRALLETALRPEPLDELFERLAVKQYTRQLLFSTVVQTMALVACRIYKSPRSVYTDNPDWFPV